MLAWIDNIGKLKETLSIAPRPVGEMVDRVEDCYDYWIKLLKTILQEHLPMKKMKVRAKDVPYMTLAWNYAIRAKRQFAKRYSINKTPQNLEPKRKWRNEATRQRRIAIKQYWKEVLHDLKSNPKKFFQTFKPFLDRKDKEDNRKRKIHLSIDSRLQRDKLVVAEHLTEYFSSIAKGIGGEQAEDLTEEDLIEHSSLHLISTYMEKSNDPFCFRSVNHHEVKDPIENLSTRKAI